MNLRRLFWRAREPLTVTFHKARPKIAREGCGGFLVPESNIPLTPKQLSLIREAWAREFTGIRPRSGRKIVILE
jgi:hypothetical protein